MKFRTRFSLRIFGEGSFARESFRTTAATATAAAAAERCERASLLLELYQKYVVKSFHTDSRRHAYEKP